MVNTKEPILTPALIEDEKRKGLNQREIAKKYGVTPAYVSKVKHQTDTFSRTPREKVMEEFPWNVPTEMQACAPHHRIRDHAEYMATGGKGMQESKLYRLYHWYRFLKDENVVLEFSPDIPPSEGIQTGGFAYREKKESDGGYIIRINEHTTITDKGEELWKFPPRMPKPR